jgi:hypothetical protein
MPACCAFNGRQNSCGENIMRRHHFLFVTACFVQLCLVPVSNAQSSPCETVQFSPDLLQRFPNVRNDCLDVISRDGQQWAVVKADLTRTGSNAVWVKMKQRDGKLSETRKINVKPGFHVLVNGESVTIEDLPVGQELTAYVKVTEPVAALAPAANNEPLETTPLAPPPPLTAQNVQMPHTASSRPAYGALGVGLLLVGTILALLRAMRARGPA